MGHYSDYYAQQAEENKKWEEEKIQERTKKIQERLNKGELARVLAEISYQQKKY